MAARLLTCALRVCPTGMAWGTAVNKELFRKEVLTCLEM